MDIILDKNVYGASNLSMDAILDYLVVLEKSLPPKRYELFRLSPEFAGDMTEKKMNHEARRIMEFVGLSGYEVDVRFTRLYNDAGNTIPGGVNGVIPINVNPDYSDWKSVAATLAHEICHTLIFHNHIRPSFLWMTEIYTDLATIFSGLGNLTLGGCTTTLPNGNPCSLGYLTVKNYTKTYHLINALHGCTDGTIGVCDDESISDLLNTWKSKGAKGSFRMSFLQGCEKVAELQRNIYEIRRLLLVIEEEAKNIQLQCCDLFVDNPEAEPLRAFQSMYLFRNVERKPWSLEIIESSLYRLYIALDKKQTTQISTAMEYKCPKCGRIHRIDLDGSGSHILKCRCGFIYTATRDSWTPAMMEYKLSQERREKSREEQAEHDKEVIVKYVSTLPLPKFVKRFIIKSKQMIYDYEINYFYSIMVGVFRSDNLH